MFASIMAALAAFTEISKDIKLLVEGIKDLRQDAINSSLEKIKGDVNETIIKIQNAKTNEDRAKLAAELNARIRI